jgi:hypothetical protein
LAQLKLRAREMANFETELSPMAFDLVSGHCFQTGQSMAHVKFNGRAIFRMAQSMQPRSQQWGCFHFFGENTA